MSNEEIAVLDEKCSHDIDMENNGDPETSHIQADNVLCSLLRQLGFVKTVSAWKDVPKWYA